MSHGPSSFLTAISLRSKTSFVIHTQYCHVHSFYLSLYAHFTGVRLDIRVQSHLNMHLRARGGKDDRQHDQRNATAPAQLRGNAVKVMRRIDLQQGQQPDRRQAGQSAE